MKLDKFRLMRFDVHNWSVQQLTKRKRKGKDVMEWVSAGYYPTLDLAAQGLFDKLMLVRGTDETLEELIDEVRRARDDVRTAVLSHLTASPSDDPP